MSDLISKSALIEALRKDKESVYSHVFCHTECQFEDDLADDLEQMINNQPTIEAVQVVHGEWILRHIGAGHMWECSVCHKRPDIYVKNDTNFCPNCGADMRKGGAE